MYYKIITNEYRGKYQTCVEYWELDPFGRKYCL